MWVVARASLLFGGSLPLVEMTGAQIIPEFRLAASGRAPRFCRVQCRRAHGALASVIKQFVIQIILPAVAASADLKANAGTVYYYSR